MSTNKKTTKKVSHKRSRIVKTIDPADINPKKIAKAGTSQLRGFLDFIRSQGVVGMAVGLILGGSISTMVKSLIENVVMPPLGLILGSAEGIKGLTWTIGQTYKGQTVIIHYGVFLNDFINFIVIAAVVYFIIRLLKVEQFDKKKA